MWLQILPPSQRHLITRKSAEALIFAKPAAWIQCWGSEFPLLFQSRMAKGSMGHSPSTHSQSVNAHDTWSARAGRARKMLNTGSSPWGKF